MDMGEYGGELGRDKHVVQTEQAAKRLVGSESRQVRRRVGEGWPRQSHPAYLGIAADGPRVRGWESRS